MGCKDLEWFTATIKTAFIFTGLSALPNEPGIYIIGRSEASGGACRCHYAGHADDLRGEIKQRTTEGLLPELTAWALKQEDLQVAWAIVRDAGIRTRLVSGLQERCSRRDHPISAERMSPSLPEGWE
ncbi:MAG: hypothetical protein ACYC55_06490 [Candidatus Geothermincolia bacterium]